MLKCKPNQIYLTYLFSELITQHGSEPLGTNSMAHEEEYPREGVEDLEWGVEVGQLSPREIDVGQIAETPGEGEEKDKDKEPRCNRRNLKDDVLLAHGRSCDVADDETHQNDCTLKR